VSSITASATEVGAGTEVPVETGGSVGAAVIVEMGGAAGVLVGGAVGTTGDVTGTALHAVSHHAIKTMSVIHLSKEAMAKLPTALQAHGQVWKVYGPNCLLHRHHDGDDDDQIISGVKQH
jgi:hypothetical protein